MRPSAARRRLQVVPDAGPAPTAAEGPDGARVSPDHPSTDRFRDDADRYHPEDEPAPAGASGTGPSGIRRIGTATVATTGPLPGGTTAGHRRLTPYESGLAAVARHDVHIERVWPMRSPSTGTLGESSSACSQGERRGTPPAGILPVGGLRMSQAFSHQPVMAREVVDLFGPVPPGLVLDATLGGGGHASSLLDALPHLGILGIDRDPSAVAAASEALAPFGSRAVVRQARFDGLGRVVREVQAVTGVAPGEAGLSGVLFDLGVSSHQLDVPDRGFSYRSDAPLDMRMDPTSGRTAADVVNGSSEEYLADLFADNGEGRFARRIARAIVAARPVTTTGQLADVVKAAIPAATRRTGGHPARRVFQAIRIAVNEEIDQLGPALDAALELLRPGGRCVVISYHSGEDRLVKATFTRAVTDDCHCPPGLPCVCGADPQFRLVVRGAKRPGAEEVERNHRAEAARLRAVERLVAAERSSTNGEVA
ncbi:MAG: 16S rRNA (cytosine(1402)-N(4))-methyltransferase RsmH [Acidimicrobiales bacterium]